jgi:soluble lytic murein transglycosylase-like protein
MDQISGFTSDHRSGRYAVWGRVAVALTAVALMRPVGGEIYLRDDGASGIALSNQPDVELALEFVEAHPPTIDAAPAVGAATPAAATVTPPAPLTRREQLALLVSAAAATHGLPEELLTAVIEVESNFDAAAVSPAGAVGLMQLMPGTARYLGVKNAHDPASNIDGGARYLKKLLGRFDNNLHLALAAYNAGPSTVLRSGTIPPYAETQRYVPKVIQRYHSLLGGRAKTH